MNQDPQARRAVLTAVARTPDLFEPFVLKGGLALHYVYGSPRRSDDLDFDAVGPFPTQATPEGERRVLAFCHALQHELAHVAADFGFARMRVQHKQLLDEFPCILTEVGYAEDPEAEPPFETAVEMQVTLNEAVCATARADFDGIPIHVPTLEDILAGKLKALLQQPEQEKPRSSDVYDLWYFTAASDPAIEPAEVVRFLRQKAARWPGLVVSRAGFHHPAVRERAAAEYAPLADRLVPGAALPDYDDAFDAVLHFTDGLDIPEGPTGPRRA